MENISIQTTQNVAIEYELASLGDRYVAGLIDFFVLIMYTLGTYLTFDFLYENWIAVLLITLPLWLYDLLFEVFFQGQTLGKMIMNIKVVKLDGTQASLSSYFLRWLFRLIDVLLSTGGIAVFSIIASEHSQRLGDMAAGTTVISLKNDTSLSDTTFVDIDPNYEVMFAQVANLSDEDMNTVKHIIVEADKMEDNRVILNLATHLSKLLQIDTTMPARTFLNTLLKDYSHINAQ